MLRRDTKFKGKTRQQSIDDADDDDNIIYFYSTVINVMFTYFTTIHFVQVATLDGSISRRAAFQWTDWQIVC